MMTCYPLYREFKIVKEWKLIRNDKSITNKQKIIKFSERYPVLFKNGKFLQDYGFAALSDRKAHLAVRLLENSRIYYFDTETHDALAFAYEYIGRTMKAEEQLNFLLNYSPHKFIPKYRIFAFYLRQKDFVKAEEAAKNIISAPVKIPSSDVELIVKEASDFLFVNKK